MHDTLALGSIADIETSLLRWERQCWLKYMIPGDELGADRTTRIVTALVNANAYPNKDHTQDDLPKFDDQEKITIDKLIEEHYVCFAQENGCESSVMLTSKVIC